MSAVIRYEETVNADAAISLFKALEEKHPASKAIHVICDNARYYRSKKVQEFLKTSRVTILFLPPYSPNLNVIERCWKYYENPINFKMPANGSLII